MPRMDELPLITSILDNDWYKFTMGQTVFNHFPNAHAKYSFINRGKTTFPPGFGDRLRRQIQLMSILRLKPEEDGWLRKVSRYMKPTYIDWLSGYSYNPDEVKIIQTNGDLSIDICGPWYRSIWWEIPILSLVSELYFGLIGAEIDRDWLKRARHKAEQMQAENCYWIDFGTRRRYSFAVQRQVDELMREFKNFGGTSNPYLAYLLNLTPIGTYAHEGPMAMQAKVGLRMSNRAWTNAWVDEFQGDLGIALPDTLTSEVFLRDFGLLESKLFDGMRQDSGDPANRAEVYLSHYEKMRIDAHSKRIVFSDRLSYQKLIALTKQFRERIKVTGGIGTHLTNDCGPKPLNIVIKMTQANFGQGWHNVVKLSDDKDKWTGNSAAIAHAKMELDIK